MLTPFRKPKTNQEAKYNDAQMQTRVLVENTIGILKARLVYNQSLQKFMFIKP